MTQYLIIVSIKDSKLEESFVRSHLAWLSDEYDKCHFQAYGPFIEKSGGWIIAESASPETLKSVLDSDPLIKADAASYDIQPIRVGANRLEKIQPN